MMTSDSRQLAGHGHASMLLVADGAGQNIPSATQMVALVRQLGLLPLSASDAYSDGELNIPVTLRFATTDVRLDFGIGPGGMSDDRDMERVMVPIWQGVDATPIAPDNYWLRLEAISPGDDCLLLAQRLCSLSALLAARLPVIRLCWLPNQLWTDSRAISDAVMAVERQGLPPVMHLIGFVPADDGSVTTRGLDWFGLPELRIQSSSRMSLIDLVRRAARLAVEQMAVRAPLRRGRYPGIERGEWVTIEPADVSAGRLTIEAVIEPLLQR